MSKAKAFVVRGLLTFFILVFGAFGLWGAFGVLTGINGISGTWVPPTALPTIRQFEVAEMPQLAVTDLDLGARVLGAISILLTAVMAILLLWAAREVAVSVAGYKRGGEAGEAAVFTPRISRMLTRIAVIVLVADVARLVVDAVSWPLISRSFERLFQVAIQQQTQAASGVSVDFSPYSIVFALGAVVCFVLGVAFARAHELEEDVNGLV